MRPELEEAPPFYRRGGKTRVRRGSVQIHRRKAVAGPESVSLLPIRALPTSSRHSMAQNDFGGVLNMEPGTASFKLTYRFLNRYLKAMTILCRSGLSPRTPVPQFRAGQGAGEYGQDLRDNANFTPKSKSQVDGQAKKKKKRIYEF